MSKKQPKFAILTSCSVTRSELPLVKVRDIPQGTMRSALDWWTDQLKILSKDKKNLRTPGELYQGIAYEAITEMAQVVGHDNVYIITGGQGLISLTQQIVPYDFTSDKHAPENIHQRIKGEKFVPTFWWGQINERMRNTVHPIADMLLADPHLHILCALPKGFIKYIVNDIGYACTELGQQAFRERMFIPLPRSMMGSFPAVARAAFIPYEQEFASGLSYSRYNKQHVVALKLLHHILLRAKEGVACWITAREIADQAQEQAAARVLSAGTDVNYGELFQAYPDMLKCTTPDQAIKLAKIHNVPYGGRHRFAAAWRGAMGHQGTVEFEDDATEAKASSALESLMAQEDATVKTQTEDELLRRCGLFIKLMRQLGHTGKPFTASTVARWGAETYGDADTSGITSAVKLVYTLEYNAEYLGLTVHRDNSKLHFTVKEVTS